MSNNINKPESLNISPPLESIANGMRDMGIAMAALSEFRPDTELINPKSMTPTFYFEYQEYSSVDDGDGSVAKIAFMHFGEDLLVRVFPPSDMQEATGFKEINLQYDLSKPGHPVKEAQGTSMHFVDLQGADRVEYVQHDAKGELLVTKDGGEPFAFESQVAELVSSARRELLLAVEDEANQRAVEHEAA